MRRFTANLLTLFTLIAILALVVACGETDEADEEAAADPSPTVEVTESAEETTPEVAESTPDATEDEATPEATEEATPDADATPTTGQLTVEEPITVLTTTVGDEEAMIYETAVVFNVSNPSEDLAAVNVPFSVVLTSNGEELQGVTDTGTLNVAPGETRIVVFRPTEVPIDNEPDGAEVLIPEDADLFVEPDEIAEGVIIDQEDWEVTDYSINCEELVAACEAVGEATWNGDTPLSNVQIHAVFRDEGGAIVAAGNGEPGIQDIEPGDTIPFAVMVLGFDQQEQGGTLTMPEGELDAEFYFEIQTIVGT